MIIPVAVGKLIGMATLFALVYLAGDIYLDGVDLKYGRDPEMRAEFQKFIGGFLFAMWCLSAWVTIKLKT